MKREQILSFLWSVILAFLMSYGAVGALATGFDMTYHIWVPVILALAAVICGVCFTYFGGAALALGILALGCGYVWRTGDLVLQMQVLLHRVSSCFHSAYGWAVLSWPNVDLKNIPIGVPMILVGAVIILCVSWTVCRKQPAWPAVGLSLLPLVTCVVVTDTVPDSKMLFLYFLGLILLLLTQSVRRKDGDAGNRLAVMLTLPAALALALLFWLVPQDTYKPLDESVGDKVLSWYDSLREMELEQEMADWFYDSLSPQKVEKVKLETLSNRREYRFRVMEVTAPTTGSLYLRGYAYDVYDGISWESSDQAWVKAHQFWSGKNALGSVKIETRGVHDVIYFPYAPGNGPVRDAVGGTYLNSNEWTSYSFTQYGTDGYQDYLWTLSRRKAVNTTEMSQYLQLPGDTRQEAKSYLRQHLGSKLAEYPEYQVLEVAEKIRQLVSDTCPYSLNVDRMPAGEPDFAMWFLKEGRTGYCVHYATAATVLLRAAGIPARYVTGYLVDAKAGTAVEVVEGDAHAWVEYWHPDLGWLRMEATPGRGTPEGTEGSPSDSEDITRPPLDEDKTTRPSTQQTPSNGTEDTEDPVPPQEEEVAVDWGPVLRGLAMGIGCLVLLIGQWKLRVRYRQYRMKQGSANEQALYRWRFMQLQAALLGIPPAEEARILAEKAKFSQHELTGKELAMIGQWQALYEAQLREQSFLRRVINCLVFAAY